MQQQQEKWFGVHWFLEFFLANHFIILGTFVVFLVVIRFWKYQCVAQELIIWWVFFLLVFVFSGFKHWVIVQKTQFCIQPYASNQLHVADNKSKKWPDEQWTIIAHMCILFHQVQLPAIYSIIKVTVAATFYFIF